jgi:hypothetical protein
MPQVRTKLSERMANKRQVKPRKFMTDFDDLTNMADVLFVGLDGETRPAPSATFDELADTTGILRGSIQALALATKRVFRRALSRQLATS